MYNNYNQKEERSNKYKVVEAMYRKDKSLNEIILATKLPKMTVLDMIQKIFARDMARNLV